MYINHVKEKDHQACRFSVEEKMRVVCSIFCVLRVCKVIKVAFMFAAFGLLHTAALVLYV